MLPFKEKPAVAKLAPTEINNYTYEEALAISLAYFDGDELAAKVFVDKYALRGHDGTLQESNPDQMHVRMAREFGRVERRLSNPKADKRELSKYGQRREFLSIDRIYNLFKKFNLVVPQGSVMAILGNENVTGSLSNCFVLPAMTDSYGGIMYADQQLVQLQKRRGGTGLDLSALRPEGTRVNNAALTSTGLVSFMERFSNTTREVAQGGRRGASMLTCDIAHPDVEKFITIKQDLKKVTGANISVRLSDEFMQAVKDDKEYTHRWPIESTVENAKYKKTVRARDLWDVIIKCAHNTAEPGLIFWDRQHWYSPSSVYPQFKNLSTNPCSEIAMQGGDSCRLMAMNLYGFVNKPFTPEASFDHEKFYETTYESQRLMDDLVDLELEAVAKIIAKIEADPEPDHVKRVELETWQKIRESGMKGRRTGLGFTGLADTMAALGFRYDSADGLGFIEEMMRTKLSAEFDSSVDMAVERGKFDGFDSHIEQTSHFVQMMQKEFNDVYSRMMRHGRRNVSISTVAPTGTLSILTQTSSGLEPVFMTSYK
ncbi:MAG: ribonucleoside-diphosphate reductase, adenosylcobalamin-dependent, partial [Thaumarchaeota archaeon]|nr:ribonucleoside-diphosphate reductase, adenosylcobalamin-dependent [Nitrososphaerota archaeon]